MLSAAAVLFAATFAARLVDESPGDPVTLLFLVPIAIVAAALGFRWGLGAAALALGLFVAWATVSAEGGDLGPLAYLTEAGAYLLLGGLVGSFADRSRRAADAYRELYETAPIGYHSLDSEGRFVEINEAELSWLGHSANQVVGKLRFADVLTAESRRIFEASFSTFREVGARDLEFEIVRKDGTAIPVLLNATVATDADRNDRLSHCTLVDITERRRAEKAALEAQDEAERANRAKSEFLSRMSHELRTPLNSILGFAQLLELDELESDQREGVERILKGGRHLLDLINEVLDISRIETGQMSISPEPVNVGEAVGGTLELIRPMAAERGLRLEIHPSATGEHYVRADRQRLKQVLLNLLSNAVKYNREGGTVTASVAAAPDDRLRILVSDTGYGIPPERLENMFVPFERLGEEGGSVEGTGLGLALSKRLAEVMGGTLSAETEVGVGSTFCLELSRERAPAPRTELSEEIGKRPSPRRLPAASRLVLYIEDNAANLRLVEEVLARRPEVKLLPAIAGGLGLELARQHLPDLILLDLHLPGISGKDVLRRLKGDSRTREIPVVVITADATPGQIDRLLAAGANAYLTKPLDVRRLLGLVDDVLSGGQGADQDMAATR